MTIKATSMMESQGRGAARFTAVPVAGVCDFEKVLACLTRPHWTIARGNAGCGDARPSSLDAVLYEDSEEEPDLCAASTALKPLGRLIAVAGWDCAEALERGAAGSGLMVTSRLVLDDGRRVVVAERAGDAGCAVRRTDAHPGAYKMSRFKAYHQMQSTVARLVPAGVREVIEIGDSNGVIRDMLGTGEGLDYFRAHYPPHDLQTLHLIPDQSRDVFICDNTLEHVADPQAAVRQMARVLRPGGWLVLFAPFIAMCQDDDRCRWSVRALGELLAPHFDAGMLGGWGNVEAACWYMRANKWLRVVGQRGSAGGTGAEFGQGMLLCRDSRVDGSPIVEVPAANDRLHPIHVWAVARRAGGDVPVPPGCRLASYLGLNLDHKPATAALVRHVCAGASILIAPSDDGSLADRLIELGLNPVTLAGDPALATAVLSRGLACVAADGAGVPFDAAILNAGAEGADEALPCIHGSLASCGVAMVLGTNEEIERCTRPLASCGLRRSSAQPAPGSALFIRVP